MNIPIRDICTLLLIILSSLSNQKLCKANDDTLNITKSIRYDETLVSSGGVFELGFFSPENSTNWYVGIWYKNITIKTAVWVANREIPLKNSTSGILKVIQPGVLVLLNDTNDTVWSSNTSSRVADNPIAQLLDSGNLVLRDGNDDHNYLWQSFDYPTDTFLIGMNFGWNYATGIKSYLSSWKSSDDPAPGEFTLELDPTGYPQMITKRGSSVTLNRMGPWNGITLSGLPDLSTDPSFKFSLYMNKNGVYYRGDAIDDSAISRFTLNPSGVGQRWLWVNRTQSWVLYLNIPAENCDTYKLCGAYGSCNIGDFPVCGCLDKFVPRDPVGWANADWSSGCVRRTALNCTVGDGFLKYSGIKLPDARTSWYNESMTIGECRVECLKNCSCNAYANLNISGGGGSGCLLWFGDLVDIRVWSGHGQDLYIRMASSDLGSNGKRKKSTNSVFDSSRNCSARPKRASIYLEEGQK